MSEDRVDVFGGVDTGRDIHVAAVVDGVGRVVGSESFGADESGYGRMVAWFRARGALVRVGVGRMRQLRRWPGPVSDRRPHRGGGGQPS